MKNTDATNKQDPNGRSSLIRYSAIVITTLRARRLQLTGEEFKRTAMNSTIILDSLNVKIPHPDNSSIFEFCFSLARRWQGSPKELREYMIENEHSISIRSILLNTGGKKMSHSKRVEMENLFGEMEKQIALH